MDHDQVVSNRGLRRCDVAGEVELPRIRRGDSKQRGRIGVVLAHLVGVIGEITIFGRVHKEQDRVERERGQRLARGEIRLAPAQRIPRPLPVDAERVERRERGDRRPPRPLRQRIGRRRERAPRDASRRPGVRAREQRQCEQARQDRIGLPGHARRHPHRRQMIDEGRVEAHPHPVVVPEIHEVEKQQHALRQREIGEPAGSRAAPPRRIEKRYPPEDGERQEQQQSEPQVELGSEVESPGEVSRGRSRERFVKRDPEREAEYREYGEVDRRQSEQEASEAREATEHFRRSFRRPAPMSRTAT